MKEIAPGLFTLGTALQRPKVSKTLVKATRDYYMAGYEDGLRAGKLEFLKIASEIDVKMKGLVDGQNRSSKG